MNSKKVFLILFLALFLVGMVSAGNYVYSNAKTIQGKPYNSFDVQKYYGHDDSYCKEGQDFIIQVSPVGCTPAVVRSDLLEEEDVDVFCQIQAIKINPLVSVESISSINFKGGSLPKGVRSVAYHPSRAALNRNGELNGMTWNNIGYLVVTISREVNESAMPEFISGNVVADIKYKYNREEGFGRQTFYLPEIDDKTFEKNMGLYSFFDKKGYLRATDIGAKEAIIGIFSDRLNSPSKEGSTKREQIRNLKLKKGQTENILLPGQDCHARISVKLDDVSPQEERVKLAINSEIIEVMKDENFLDDKCVVREIHNSGINKEVKIRCVEDLTGSNTFTLRITPKIILNIDGKESEYNVGEKLYEDKDGFPVYLGYADIDGNNPPEGLKVGLLRAPRKISNDDEEKLTDDEIKVTKFLMEKESKDGILSYISSHSLKGIEWIVDGKSSKILYYGKRDSNTFDKEVSVVGFGGGLNKKLQLSGIKEGIKSRENYDKAVEDYETLTTSFFSEKDPINDESKKTLSEKGLVEKIELASSLKQNLDVKTFCLEFESLFPNSNEPTICNDVIRLANNDVSTQEVLINGNSKMISFENVYVPNKEDYGIIINVKKDNEVGSNNINLGKNMPASFDSVNYIELEGLDSNSAKIRIDIKKTRSGETYYKNYYSKSLVEGKIWREEGYTFTLKKINLKEMAKVIVNANARNDRSYSNLTFKVGIEKRAIQLSPEQTRKKIDKINSTIKNWEKISKNLGGVVEGMKTACLATGTVFTLKNLILNSGGKGVARKKVMENYKDICSPLVAKGDFNTLDACYFKRSNEIEKNVTRYYDIIKNINSNIKKINENSLVKDSNIIDGKVVDTEKALKEYAEIVSEKITLTSSTLSVEINKQVKTIDTNDIIEILKSEDSKNIFDFEDLKDIEFYLDAKDDKNLFLVYEQILKNSDSYNKEKSFYDKNKNDGYGGNFPSTGTDKNRIIGKYEGEKIKNGMDFPEEYLDSPIQGYVFNQKRYWFILESTGKGEYGIVHIYDYDTKKDIKDENEIDFIKNHFDHFEKTIKMEKNGFTNPVVRFFSSGIYANLPSFVPIDTVNGWYVQMKSDLPSFNKISAYHDSGKLNAFELCNVGINSIAADSDDECLGIIANQRTDASIGGLSQLEKDNLVRLAINEVSKLSKLSKKTGTVVVNGKSIKIGSPETESVNGECSDYMSPKECKILFNLCDPVICPTSRCDLGGNYKVRDVVQSGIVGSLALCLPNVKEGIAVPICLTGVKAGIDSLLSTSKAHRDCLQESLDTGRTVGICDQQNSVYLCELLWKEAIPIAQVAIPKIFSAIAGENTHGGAEYISTKSAWDNARDSVAFFTSSYALNSVKAFKARSTNQGEVGGAVCKKFVSMSYPKGQSFLKNLVSSDSPHQFNANFDEISQNTVTNPPISHYKVFYNIYSGKDSGTYYKVWLRGSETSYYNDQGATRIIADGYIKRDDYASESKDFTAPAGYKEICVSVDDQEECGFKKVSTSFSSNFFQDKYRKEEVNKTNIKSEGECISGSPNLLAVGIASNIQEGLSDVVNPQIYNQGISRVCATKNPGYSTDTNMGEPNQRWVEVGNCGSDAMKCWLDVETIDDAFVFNKTTQDLKKEFSDDYDKNFMRENGYLDDDFKEIIKNITSKKNPETRIKMINEVMDKIFKNYNKAYLYYTRAGAYAELAKINFKIYAKKLIEKENKEGKVSRNKVIDIYDIVGANDFVSDKIEVKFSGFNSNLYFRYNKGRWYWVDDLYGSITTVSSDGTSNVKVPISENDWYSVEENTYLNNINNIEKDFIKSLRNKNYIDGFNIIREKVAASKSKSDFIRSGSVEMSPGAVSQLFTLSNVPDIDDLYFRTISVIDEGKVWKWNFEDSKKDADWYDVNKISQKIDISYIGSLWNRAKNMFGAAPLDFNVKEIPEDYKLLLPLLDGKDSEEGALILFSDKSTWKKLSEKTIVSNRGWDPTEALDKLQELEGKYYDNKDVVFPEVKTFIEELLNDELLSINTAFGQADPYLLKEDKSSLEKIGDPDFGKIRGELLLLQENNKNSVADSLPELCGQYSNKVYESSAAWGIDSNLLWGVIKQESKCDTMAVSNTGCKGLLQFCAPTAKDYNLCDKEKGCVDGFDYRSDPDKSIEAGSKYLSVLIKRYKGYSDGLLFAIASYNGGMGLIDDAVKNAKTTTGSEDPRWEDVSLELTSKLLEENTYDNAHNWNDVSRKDKIKQIRDYVVKVVNNMNEISKSEKVISTTEETIKNKNALDEINSIDGFLVEIKNSDYSGNYNTNKDLKYLVDLLYSKKMIDEESYNIIVQYNFNQSDIISSLSGSKDYINSRIQIIKLEKDYFPVKETINYITDLKGDYGDYDNSFIVDLLCKDRVFDVDKCNDIKGVGWFDTEEKMSGRVTSYLIGLSKNKETFIPKKKSNEIIVKKEESCQIIDTSSSIISLSTAEKKVLATVEELDGTPRVGGIWSGSCYNATQYVYNRAGVVTEGNCIYSDKVGKKYFNGELITQSDSKKLFFANEKCKVVDSVENLKLNGINPGYLLSVAYNKNAPHNLIFINWLDKSKNLAKVFDWNANGGTSYGYQTYDLSDDSHPVFMYWEPRD